MPKIYCISLCRLPIENLLIYSFSQKMKYDLKYGLKVLGSEEKCEYEIWLNDLNTSMERCEIWV